MYVHVLNEISLFFPDDLLFSFFPMKSKCLTVVILNAAIQQQLASNGDKTMNRLENMNSF